MNRNQKIIRAILEALILQDGNAVPELVLHAEVNLRVSPNALISEYETAARECEILGWTVGIRTDFQIVKWRLTDNGKAALLNMRK